MRKLIATAAIAIAAATASADVKLPAIISDNMCLQAEKTLPIWGKADPGENVTVTLGDQTQSTSAGPDGKWIVKLHKLSASDQPVELKVVGKNTIEVKNIIVGEVWVASGQSNMEFGFHNAHDASVEGPKAKHPSIRIFNLKKKIAFEPQWDCEGNWEECTPETVDHTSAVGYFFSHDIHEALHVPVGLIHTSWRGSPAEAWTSLEDLESEPETEKLGKRFETIRANIEEAKTKYTHETLPKWNAQLDEWKEKYATADEATRRAHPAPPQPVAPDNDPHVGSVLYNGMIAPIIPFSIEGAIWYQGEANAGNPVQYRTLFPEMINDWRKHWGEANADDKELAFYWVQLPNFMARQPEPVQDSGGWPGLREAQHLTLALPNTGEAVTIDIGEETNGHPKNKHEVGHRLALAALHGTYHKDIVFNGPTYRGFEAKGDKAIVKFDNVGGGLIIAAAPAIRLNEPAAEPAKELKGFSIAGEDRQFHWAQAKIEGDTVVVWSDKVSNPVAVRYAWGNNPECNLYNREHLPASPFRTDKWEPAAPAPLKRK
jgi:sialate O-acetylesterase